jgi:DNA-binding LytR/AlgR family response regulator
VGDLNIVVCLAFDLKAPADGVARFKDCIIHCPAVESVMEVSGAFDLIVTARVDSLAEYTAQMERIRDQLSAHAARVETSFVGRTVSRRDDAESSWWLPCTNGRRRIDIGMIDKVVAEGDYMRIFVGDWQCLVHETIRELKDRLDSRFIQLHRSSIVRIDFIDRLLHQERRWVARLNDGSEQPVAKSHVADVLSLFSTDSSNNGDGLARNGSMAESSIRTNEYEMNEAD